MKNLKYSLVLLALTSVSATNAQQLTQLSQYLQNHFVVNPAAMGLNDEVDLNLGFRKQWVRINGAPQTYYFSGHSLISRKETPRYNPALRTGSGYVVKAPHVQTGRLKHAVGGNLLMDEFGPFKRFSGNASYSVHVPLTASVNLSCGLGIGISNMRFDPSKATILNSNDQTYNSFVGVGNAQNNLAELSAGVYMYSQRFFMGYSAYQFMQNRVSFGDPTSAKLLMHHFAMAGYRIYLNEDWSVMPNFLVKFMNPSPLAVDLNMRVDYLNRFFFGASYRHQDAVVGIVGFNYNGFKFGYAFDCTISSVKSNTPGGHEIVLGYKWSIGKRKE